MTPEAEFLALRAEQAKLRMRRTTSEMVDGVLTPLEVRPVVRRHPWASLGVGLLGGLLTGLGLRRVRTAKAGKAAFLATAKAQPKGSVGRLLGAAVHRARRMVTSALGAVVVANLRDAGRAAASRNGRSHH